jgi:hypothetical protein
MRHAALFSFARFFWEYLAFSTPYFLIAGSCCIGCRSNSSLSTKVVQGRVTYGQSPVEEGMVRFVPIEGTHGPMSFGSIDHGYYRVDSHGGVPLGTHRVEVDAWKKTGRKVTTRGRFESEMSEERERLGPEVYSGETSPLRIQLTADSSDRFDIQIPAK